MTPTVRLAIKVAAGTISLVGVIFSFIERRYAPTYLIVESSSTVPDWVGWASWALATVGLVTYVLVDVAEWWVHRR